MSADEIGEIYYKAFGIYWDKVLLKGDSPNNYENETFLSLIKVTNKWYSDQSVDQDKKDQIMKNAASAYLKNIIKEKVLWQRALNDYLTNGSRFDTEKFESGWRKVIEGENIFGYFNENGEVVYAEKAMSFDKRSLSLISF